MSTTINRQSNKRKGRSRFLDGQAMLGASNSLIVIGDKENKKGKKEGLGGGEFTFFFQYIVEYFQELIQLMLTIAEHSLAFLSIA